jgi:hypothetical protein
MDCRRGAITGMINFAEDSKVLRLFPPGGPRLRLRLRLRLRSP